MSKLSNAAMKMKEESQLRREESITNFMGGDSYVINPLDTLKMVTASSIYGEPAYYRAGNSNQKASGRYTVDPLVKNTILPSEYTNETTDVVMENSIDSALDYDFGGTLSWAESLRHDFNMRLNPQVIMVRAAIHPKRAEFTAANPGMFDRINQNVMCRPDEPMTQMAYYLYKNNGKKNNIPSIIKRSWANRMSKLNRKQIAKYKNHEIGMINAVRLCHANSFTIDELMTSGTVEVVTDEKTWENLRSEGKSWKEIFHSADMGHMALLRNLRGVFTEVDDIDFCKEYLIKLKCGVPTGMQFPFRYYSAIKAVEASTCNHKAMIVDALEECLEMCLSNYPKLKGKTMCLSDNSGSAWGSCNSEYGTVTIAEIDNLSSVITAACSDDGYVGRFGNTLNVTPISKRRGVLMQAEALSSKHGNDVGHETEGGIWEFFRLAIANNEHWDNIFIYSDQQAGHGGLYGTAQQAHDYKRAGYACGINRRDYINVYKLIEAYRKKVNPKVNVFSVQTAGYDNILIPEMAYRTAIQYGWTGKEAVFAAQYIHLWDEIENRN